jgi:hypothetical protein
MIISTSEAEALLGAATPGPWRIENKDCGDYWADYIEPDVMGVSSASDQDLALMAAAPDLAATVVELHAEVARLRARLRETAQILIAEIGADGPMNAEDAARKAVERLSSLRESNPPKGGTMTPAIIAKIQEGDRLTDDELNVALEFYSQMEKGLRLLGPHYHLPWAAVRRVHDELQSYRLSRDADL